MADIVTCRPIKVEFVARLVVGGRIFLVNDVVKLRSDVGIFRREHAVTLVEYVRGVISAKIDPFRRPKTPGRQGYRQPSVLIDMAEGGVEFPSPRHRRNA